MVPVNSRACIHADLWPLKRYNFLNEEEIKRSLPPAPVSSSIITYIFIANLNFTFNQTHISDTSIILFNREVHLICTLNGIYIIVLFISDAYINCIWIFPLSNHEFRFFRLVPPVRGEARGPRVIEICVSFFFMRQTTEQNYIKRIKN